MRLVLCVLIVLILVDMMVDNEHIAAEKFLEALREESAPDAAATDLELSQVLLPPLPTTAEQRDNSPVADDEAGARRKDRAMSQKRTPTDDSRESGITIDIGWPRQQAERDRVRRVLHQCHGVRLAKLDDEGRAIAVEAPATSSPMSEYARVVERAMAEADSRFIEAHAGGGGRLVRLYPAYFDQTLFNALGGGGSLETGVSGQFRWLGGSLMMTDIEVDGRRRPPVRLSSGCR